MKKVIDQYLPTISSYCSAPGFTGQQLTICINSAMHEIGRKIEVGSDFEFTPEVWNMFDDAAPTPWRLKSERIFDAAFGGAMKGIIFALFTGGIAWLIQAFRRQKFSNKPSIVEEQPNSPDPIGMRAKVSRKTGGLPDFVPVVADDTATMAAAKPFGNRHIDHRTLVRSSVNEAAPPRNLAGIILASVLTMVMLVGVVGAVSTANQNAGVVAR